jgi:hypothetical protein
MSDAAVLVYVVLSLLIAGIAVTYDLHSPPTMLDRADGRGKFPSPKSTLGELIGIGVFVALVWPLLFVVWIFDGWGKKP